MGLSGTATADHAPAAAGPAPAPAPALSAEEFNSKIPSPTITNPDSNSNSPPTNNATTAAFSPIHYRTAILTPESLTDEFDAKHAAGHRAQHQQPEQNHQRPQGSSLRAQRLPIMPPASPSQLPQLQQPRTTQAPSVRPSDLSPYTTSYHEQQRKNVPVETDESRVGVDAAAQPQSSESPSLASSLVARDQDKPQSHSQGLSASDDIPTVADLNTTTTATATVESPSLTAPEPSITSLPASPTSPTSPLTQAFPPLYTGNVLPETKIAHPKPITLPASGSSTPLPTKPHASSNPRLPEQSIRNSAFVGNVAQLEATAERLSTGTSSIGDAIKDLHCELKRSDSRRSSILAASLRAQTDDTQTAEAPAVGQLKRHLSNASSIVATNSAARHGGYSPGAFVMSPSHSLTGRLRSGSKNSAGRPDFDVESSLTRHGPGKASVRSVRSTKLSLAEISESEPTALNQEALDAADAAPPLEFDDTDNEHDDTLRPDDAQPAAASGTESFHQMLQQSAEATAGQLAGTVQRQTSDATRPIRSNSVNTFQQAQEAFVDFDGTHWEPESDNELEVTPELSHELSQEQRHIHFAEPMNLDLSMPHKHDFSTPHVVPADMPRPQSYFDHETGQHMLYYPAPVPAMINLPPKLSNKPKAGQRQDRRSKILHAMADANKHSEDLEAKRKSGMPEASRDSWLPDPLVGHRGSFIALSQENLPADETRSEAQPQPDSPTSPTHLRKPQRLSRTEPENRQNRASRLDKLPPQLRASAFFDLPPAAPEVEVKEGSAMATLDSMLDASTTAPVSAFTNHSFAGGLGSEVYGKEKKHKSKVSTSSLKPEDANKEKKRASRSWFKRGSSYNSQEQASNSRSRSPSALGDVHGDSDVPETQGLASDIDGQSVRRPEDAESDADSEEDSDYVGQPTTLLAELQLRKQQQKHRTAPRAHGQGSYMTLLEMDAVAETQRKQRQNKRVNLAWEDPNAHLDQNGSDDEDVPLAIIAAKQQGAKNMADLERPIGLMERREMEDNEPLSHRRARLQGHQPMTLGIPKRQSIAGLSTHLGGHVRTPSTQPPRSQAVTPEPAEPEIEEETLGARKKRLEAKDLPRARPVSSSFSAELLSQFGDLDYAKDKPADDKSKAPSPAADEEEETLGQRRRRLQAEREAREREMSYSNLTGQPTVTRRLSMADMLSAHPKKETDNRASQARQRLEQEQFATQARDARMAAMRMQMPQTLNTPGVNRAGAYGGGIYNDGFGGQAIQSTSALQTQGVAHVPRHNRSTTALSAYGMPIPQQGGYAPSNYGGMSNMGGFNGMNNPYARASMHMPMQMQMEPPQMNVNSMKRVDQWRHGVMP